MRRALGIAAVAAVPALLALHRIDAADIWVHLATGRLIARAHALPVTDPFGAPPAAPWLVHDWLASLALAGVEAIGGFSGLVLFTALLCTAAAVLPLVLTARDRLPPVPVELAVLAGTWIAYERFFVRPEAFTFLILALWVQALARGAPRDKRQLALLCALQAAWANMHAAFVLGPVLAALVPIGDVVESLRRERRWRWPPALRLALPFATLAACLVNPYGVRLLAHIVRASRAAGASELRRGIAEWQPTFAAPVFSDVSLIAFTLSLVAVATIGIACRRRVRAFESLAVLALAVLSCTSRRHLALWAFGALPLAAAWAARGWAARAVSATREAPASAAQGTRGPAARPTRRQRMAQAASFVVPVLALTQAVDIASGGFYRRFGPPRTLGLGVSESDHPIGAGSFVARHELSGPVYNNVAAGSYLIASVGPRLPVWVDGRLLDVTRFAAYRRALESPPAFDALASERGFRLVVLALQPFAPLRLMRHLISSPQWRLVFLDGEGAVFVRATEPGGTQTPANAQPALVALDVTAALPARDAPVGPGGHGARRCEPGEALRRGIVLQQLGFAIAARADLTRALAHCSADPTTALWLGRAMLASGDARAANDLLERAIAAFPSDPEAWFDLGRGRAALGDMTAATECWRRVLVLDPAHAGARAMLGNRSQAGSPR